jgi:iron uptake system component EfeO
MTGDGVGRATLTVRGTSAGTASDETSGTGAAATAYLAYVRSEAAVLLGGTRTFAAAYAAGDTAKARSLYARTRASYERIEPVAEKFGSLDAALDAREGDVPSGADWTGWHRIEKDLWRPSGTAPLTASARSAQARTLVSLTEQLVAKVDAPSFTLTASTVSNGAIGLLDEIAATKITGEEERYSHTDLWDFSANLDGSLQAVQLLRPVVAERDPALATALDQRFAATRAALDAHRQGDGYRPYTALTQDQTRALSDSITALAARVSEVPAAVAGR